MGRFLAVVALLAVPSSAPAVIIHVLADGSGDAPTIAAALVIAAPNDVISLGPGTFYEHDLVWKTRVGLVSDTGDPTTTFIDAQGLGRCIDISDRGPIPFSSITGITFQNGVTNGAGGLIKADNSNFRFQSCAFRNGSAANGGAVGTTLGQFGGQRPLFVDCVFENNSATLGGALGASSGIPPLRCQFRGNTAESGGAIYLEKPQYDFGIFIEDCVFENNVAAASGGAIFSTGNQENSFFYGTFIRDCSFRGNRAQNGGALHISQFDTAMECLYFENSASEAGGAIYGSGLMLSYELDGGEVSFSLFARNAANFGGAVALIGQGEPLYFFRNTFALNQASSGAHLGFVGAIGTTYMTNCILAFGIGGAAAAGTPTTVRCFDVYGNADGDWVGPLAGQLGANNNISADPQFCDVDSDNYRLAEGSPCLQTCPGGYGWYGLYGIGCAPTAVESSSWGEIKGRFAVPR